MSRQRLRESSVQWNISLTNESFAQKVIKVIEINAIKNKAKLVEITIPEKIKNFLKIIELKLSQSIWFKLMTITQDLKFF